LARLAILMSPPPATTSRGSVEGATESRQHNVWDSVELQEGSFFDSVPTGGDVYVLKMILHDWPDDTAVEILQSVRSVAEVGTRVLVIDCVIPDHDREFFGHWTDLEMLLLQAGRERTVPEYRRLLERAGYRITRWVPTASSMSFLEAEAI
jgi:C-methyltransferase